LKDAASSAIYGSRGANGVILITTKQGQEGKVRLTYTGNLSVETVAKRFNIVTDYADFMEYQNQARLNNGNAIQFPQEEIDKWRNDAGRNPRVYPNTDWQDHAYRDPTLVQTHNINVSGGSKSVRYNMTLGYVHNPGMLNCTEYTRYQMRSNIEVDITKWLTAGMNTYGYLETVSPSSDNATQGGDAIWGGGGPFNTTPGMNLYDKETGTYGGVQSSYEAGVTNYNPYRRQWFWRTDFPTQRKRIMPKFFIRITPVKGLTLQGSYTYKFNYEYTNLQITDKPLYRYSLEPDNTVSLSKITTGYVTGQVRHYFWVTNFRTSDLTANYNFKAFNNRLETNVLLGTSQEYEHYDYTYAFKNGQPDYDNQTTLDSAPNMRNISGYYTEWAMRSYFGRLNLTWDNKYMLEANVRTDGSSRFSPEKRWGWFPSVSAGWRISEEKFMNENNDWINNLKLRASYGSLGNNSGISAYNWQSVYNAQNYILGTGNALTSGLAQTAISNYNLTWESTYVTNVGVDFSMLNSRLSGSLEYYNKDTKGILLSVPASLEHGTTGIPVTNAGRVVNKGVDFDATWTDRIGDVTYTVGFNMGYVTNKLKDYGGQTSISGVYKKEEGKPIDQLYLMDVDRIVRNDQDLALVEQLAESAHQKHLADPSFPEYFSTFAKPELGDFLYKDSNGDGKLDYNDRIEKGHGTTPTFTYGINLGAQWKGFDLSMLFQGTGSHDVFYSNEHLRFVAVHGWTLIKDVVENQWTPENPNAKYPILRNNSNSKNQINSTAFLSNAAYFRCKNLQFGYTIPRNITQKFYVENLKVYTSIDNLFTITDFFGQDPEIARGVGYPLVRQFSFGLNLSF
ncbi:MAG: SusC/RagA family TonB-linked outer membrane protein, partial [Muribaculaceae bacterium]|nr:SusC/RagA family TonB-linked outer membrane protein [Muribaculaceae bacterium]